MPEWRVLHAGGPSLLRPLLDVPREAILAYARAQSLSWVDDESNARHDADRNYLRHEVAPRLDSRFPGWRAAIARFARHAASAEDLVERIVESVDAAAPADPAFAHAALRALLARHGLRMPSEARIAEMARQVYGARPDAQVRLRHDGHEIRRYRGELYVQPLSADDRAWRVAWAGESELPLGEARGNVRFERATGDGLSARAAAQGAWYFGPRSGGERLRPRASGPSRTLKNLFQEHAVPPWQRAAMPLLFHEGRLVWAPGIGIDADYACAPGEPGLKPCWQVAGRAPLC
jgi:tRNA(Ile)-lysidine synthase